MRYQKSQNQFYEAEEHEDQKTCYIDSTEPHLAREFHLIIRMLEGDNVMTTM